MSMGQAVFGSIFGTVTDPQGGAVAGAKVTVTSITKATTYETTTNESGNYTVTHLIPDTYRVKVEGPGFKANDVASVEVSADASAHVDAQLQVGSVTQTVEVTSEVPQLKTDRADVSIEFNTRSVEELPILNRNFTSFELLTPGTKNWHGRMPRRKTHRPLNRLWSMASISAGLRMSWMAQITRIRFLGSSW